GDADPVREEAGDGLRMQALDMIAFEKGVHDQLPVRRDVVRAAAEEVMAGEIEGVELRRQADRVGEIIRFARKPDQAARLDVWQVEHMMLGRAHGRAVLRAWEGS